jgi:hypothetical protein
VCDLITDLVDLGMKPMGSVRFVTFLLKGEKRTATPGGSVAISRMKSGMHFAGSKSSSPTSRDEQMPQNETEATTNG